MSVRTITTCDCYTGSRPLEDAMVLCADCWGDIGRAVLARSQKARTETP